MKMFTTAKRITIWGLRKKVFTEFNYLVICGNAYDFKAIFYRLGICTKYFKSKY
jgi:hypothetical protein